MSYLLSILSNVFLITDILFFLLRICTLFFCIFVSYAFCYFVECGEYIVILFYPACLLILIFCFIFFLLINVSVCYGKFFPGSSAYLVNLDSMPCNMNFMFLGAELLKNVIL